MIRSLTILLLILTATADACFAQQVKGSAIIVPRSAVASVTLAARELQYYVEKATGIRMPIVEEGSVPVGAAQRIYLGATKAAHDAGIDAAGLSRDAYRVRTAGEVTYLVGGDRDGDPMSLRTPAGTLFAVYELLDNELGIRWLWPGKSGEVVPKRASLELKDRDETVLPRFRFCGLRTGRPDELLWMRRMRMHDADGIDYGHAFEKWGEKYFAQHPDWFEMDASGARHPGKSMCVSNPGFQRQVVENWWAEQKQHPRERKNLNICENDGPGACHCPNCLAWDGAAPPWPRPTPYDNVHNVSQRYARFAVAVLKLAREYDPDVEITAYAYSNLTFAPTGVEMDKHILVGFVPDVFFPRTPDGQKWVLDQWKGWSKAGASMFMRPNYLLHGYCMPVNWSRQFAEEFQLCEKHGMIGTDFDSLTGMWSTMGLSLYVAGRLHVKPQLPLDDVLAEYDAAFGPAANLVHAYWAYWERYSQEHLDVFKDGLWHYVRYPESVERRFPIESFGPAEKLMAEAERVASTDADALAKVQFLKTGLQHAKLCVEASIAFAQAGSDAGKQRAALANLLAFRKTIKDPMIVNLDDGDSSCKARETNLGWPE